MESIHAKEINLTAQSPFDLFFNLVPHYWNCKKNALQTKRRSDRRTDGRTDPLIEIRGGI